MGYMYFWQEALSTANSAYLIPSKPDEHPYSMSMWMTSPKRRGSLTVFVDTGLSMVVTSPKDRIGSLSNVDIWKLSWKTVFRCGSIFSVFR